MSRKPAIILVILLLLIGGGAVAFYSHLRAQAPPEFSEVDQFLRQFPTSSGWTFDHHLQEISDLPEGPGWLGRFGIGGGRKILRHTYSFIPAEGSGTMRVIFFSDGQQIRHYYYLDLSVSATAEFQGIIQRKFPTLPRFELFE